MTMARCIQCHAPVDLGAAACPRCGQPLDDERQAFFMRDTASRSEGYSRQREQRDPELRGDDMPRQRYAEPDDEQRDDADRYALEHVEHGFRPAHRGAMPDTDDVGEEETIWEGNPNPFFGPIARRFTHYEVTNKAIRIRTGILFRREQQLELWRFKHGVDTQGPLQARRGTGTIVIETDDEEMPLVVLRDVPDAKELQEAIRNAAEAQWRSRRMSGLFVEH